MVVTGAILLVIPNTGKQVTSEKVGGGIEFVVEEIDGQALSRHETMKEALYEALK